MRIIVDSENYFVAGSLAEAIECEYGTCQEYVGAVPIGYPNYESWFVNCTYKNAYKLVNNNLVLDEDRANKLQEQIAKETEENTAATHKWVREKLGKSNQVVIDELSDTASGTSLIVINDGGEYEIPEIKTTSENIDECNIVASNKNLLGIDTVTQAINGITFIINPDKTITLNGTAIADIELDLKGASNSLDMLFLLQKDTDYTISGLADGISLNLYNFDGTDRTLIGAYGNEAIKLSNSYQVTQTTLSITSGTSLGNVEIRPQLEIGEASDYVEHKSNKETAYFYEGTATLYELYSYSPTTVIMADKEIDMEISYFKYKALHEELTKIEATSSEIVITVSAVNDRLDVLGTNIDDTTGEVTSVRTGKGFTFNDEGLNINDPNEEFNTQITNRATQYKNGDEVITETSKDGFMTTDLKEKGTHQYGYNGSTYDFVAERIEVNGESAYAHFYNGGV